MRGVGYWCAQAGQAPQARVTRQVFDAAGRGIEQWDPRLSVSALSHGFSLIGQVLLTDSVDAGWRVSMLGQTGEALVQWDSRGTRQDFEYDTSIRPAVVMEQARGEAVRVVERFEYGGANLQVGNQCGRLIRHDDPAGTRHMPEYDVLGLAQREISHFLTALDTPDWPQDESARDALLESGMGLESRWAYNPAGDLLSLTDASDNRRRFNYSVAGQLKEGWLQPANSPAPGQCLVHDIRYNPSSQVERETAGSGVATEAEYAPNDGRLLRLAAALPGASPLQDLRYEVDAVGNIVSIEDHALPVRFFKNQRIEALRSFAYDSLGQLISATGWEAGQAASYPMTHYRTSNDANAVVNYREEYDYDPAGNLTELRHLGAQLFTRRWAIAPNSNRSLLEEHQPADFDGGFDSNGNLRFLQRGQKLCWDLRNQLASVSPVQRENEADDTERYLYGGGGKRLRKVRTALTGTRTVIAEVRYLPGLEIHLRNGAPSHQVLDLDAGRNRVQWLLGPGAPEYALRYHLTDHQGSGTLELNEHAQVQSREVYYPFGGTAWEDHSDQSGAWKTLRYSGKERDATGLYYYGYRYFAPWLSRWINPDPAGAVDGLNLYRFVGNSPVGRVDRDGRVGSPAGQRTSNVIEFDLDELLARPIDPNQSAEVDRLARTLDPITVDLDRILASPRPEQEARMLEEWSATTGQPMSAPVAGPSSAGVLRTPNRPACPTCGKVFSGKTDLNRHLRTHTGERPFICTAPGCDAAFAQLGNLTAHRRSHTGERPYGCTEPGCNAVLTTSSSLTRHRRKHTGERPYACTASGCNAAFALSGHLIEHRRTHTGERPFGCTEPGCNAAFSQSGSLTKHRRVHTDERPYLCMEPGCNSAFNWLSSLKAHRRTHAV